MNNMQQIKKEKGFTLIEVLCVIVMLGVLATIVSIGVSKVLKNSKETFYNKQMKMITLAAKTYYSDNRNLLPTNIAETNEVKLSTLIENKYIDSIKDSSGNACTNTDETTVKVVKVSQNEYDYSVTFNCNNVIIKNDSNPTVVPDGEVNITFTPKEGSSNIGFMDVIMKVDGSKQYKYVIYKKEDTSNTVFKEVKGTFSKTTNNEVTIKINGSGTYYIEGYASNGTKSKTQISGLYNITEEIPKCDSSDFKYSVNEAEKQWTNKIKLTLDLTKINNVEKYELYDINTNKLLNAFENDTLKTFTNIPNGQNNLQIKAYNYSSESCTKNIGEYWVDKEKPVIESVSMQGGTGWHNNNTYVDLTATDNLSGIAYYQYKYDNTKWITYKNSSSNSFTTTPFVVERNEYVYFRVFDNAGNYSETKKIKIQLDRTAPKLSNPSNPSGGSCNRNGFSAELKASDNLSGIAYYQYKYAGTGWNTYSDSAKESFTTTPFSAERREHAYFRVCDNAGNCSENKATYVFIDRTNPTIEEKLERRPNTCLAENFNFAVELWYRDNLTNFSESAKEGYTYVEWSTDTTGLQDRDPNKGENKQNGDCLGTWGDSVTYTAKACDMCGNCSTKTKSRHY